jgi:sugar phosphate permease
MCSVNSRRAWLVCGIGVIAYIVAVLQRTSLSVAGVEATQRFEVSATVLSSLAVVQLMVYATLQIPVGVLVDRVGPRRLILVGAVLMAVGQFTLAVAPDIAVAVLGRLLVGSGDAMTFIPVARLLAAWFSGKVLPLLTQSMGTIGQLGQVLSAFPLSFALHQLGWQPSYLGVSAISLVAGILVISIVADAPVGVERQASVGWSVAIERLRESMVRPGTQLGFWVHFVSQSSGTMFALLWGFPFLSVGLGYGPTGASALLTLMVITSMISGPILGVLSGRYPYRRSNLVLAIMAMIGVFWVSVLAWPGNPPFVLVVALVIVIAIGGPASLIGFDFARAFNPAQSIGSASGLVNVGGFLASFVMMFGIGIVLDVLDTAAGGSGVPAELYSLDSFRIAFLVQFPVIGAGVVLVLISRRKTRARMQRDEGIQIGPLWVSLRELWRRRT